MLLNIIDTYLLGKHVTRLSAHTYVRNRANDSAGKSSVEGDTSYRGGGVWLFTKSALFTRWSNTRWTESQLDKHSTETELANANCSLASLVHSHKGYDIIEVLDNKSAVQTLRRLSYKSLE